MRLISAIGVRLGRGAGLKPGIVGCRLRTGDFAVDMVDGNASVAAVG